MWSRGQHGGGQQDEQHRAQVLAGWVSWVADSGESKEWSLDEDDWDEGDVDDNGVNENEGKGGGDTLDAYLSEVSEEGRKIKGGFNIKDS